MFSTTLDELKNSIYEPSRWARLITCNMSAQHMQNWHVIAQTEKQFYNMEVLYCWYHSMYFKENPGGAFRHPHQSQWPSDHGGCRAQPAPVVSGGRGWDETARRQQQHEEGRTDDGGRDEPRRHDRVSLLRRTTRDGETDGWMDVSVFPGQ